MADTGISVSDLKAELTKLRQTISDILTTGQAYSRPGLSLSRANLPALQNREQYLIRSITRATDGMFAVGRVSGPADGQAGDTFDNPDAP